MTAAAPVRSTRERLRPIARSIFGLLAGYSTILLVWFAGYLTLLFVAARSFDARGNPQTGIGLGALLVVTVVASYLGGSIGTRLARRAPIVHAALLAAMEGATLVSVVQGFGEDIPHWFGPTIIGGSVVAIMSAGAATVASLHKSRAIHSPTK